jgi:O-antigen/teichoic acid export membrane protein
LSESILQRSSYLVSRVSSVMRSRIVRNFFSGTAMRLGSYGVSFIGVAYLARTLGPDTYGILNVAMAWMTYFSLLTTLGLPTIGIRDVAHEPSHAMKTWWKVSLLRVWLSFVAFFVLCVCITLIPGWYQERWLLLPYGLGLFITAINPSWVLVGLENMFWSLLSGLTQNALMVVGFMLFVRHSHDVNIVPWITLIAAVISLMVSFAKLAPKYETWKFTFAELQLVQMFNKAIPLILGTVLAQLYSNADLLLLDKVRGHAEAGLYSVAYRIVYIMITFIGIANQAVFPVMARLKRGVEHQAFAQRTLSLTFLICLPIAVGGSILAGPLITLLFGASFAGAAPALSILLWYILLSSISMHYSNALIAHHHDRIYLATIALGTTINLLLISWLVPRFGAVGASGAMLLAESGMLMYYAHSARRRLELRFIQWTDQLRIGVCTVVLGAVVWAARNRMHIVLLILMAMLLYVSAWVGYGALEHRLKSFLRRFRSASGEE